MSASPSPRQFYDPASNVTLVTTGQAPYELRLPLAALLDDGRYSNFAHLAPGWWKRLFDAAGVDVQSAMDEHSSLWFNEAPKLAEVLFRFCDSSGLPLGGKVAARMCNKKALIAELRVAYGADYAPDAPCAVEVPHEPPPALGIDVESGVSVQKNPGGWIDVYLPTQHAAYSTARINRVAPPGWLARALSAAGLRVVQPIDDDDPWVNCLPELNYRTRCALFYGSGLCFHPEGRPGRTLQLSTTLSSTLAMHEEVRLLLISEGYDK